MSLKNNTGRWELRIVICLLAVAPFLLTPWVHGDGIGSVAFLRSIIVGGDLDLVEEFEYLSTHVKADAGGLPGSLLDKSDYSPGLDPLFHTGSRDPVTGHVPFFASIGSPILWSPGYFLAHSLVRLGNVVGLNHRNDGYGGIYYLAIALTTLCCGMIGLVLIYRLAREVVPAREAFCALIGIVGASPLLYYLYLAPTYPHAITMLSTGAFFLYWWRNRGASDSGTWFRWGLLAGLLFLVRTNDAVVVVPALVLEAVKFIRRESSAKGSPPIGGIVARLMLALAGFTLLASVQLLSWQYFHARPLVRYPLSALGFWYEGLWGTFVSTKHGLLIWHPITALALIGILRLFARSKELAGVCIATLAVVVVSNCTIHDWWGGAAFGMRRLLSATPVFVIGLAVFFDDLRVALARGGASTAAAVAGRTDGLGARLIAPAIIIVFALWNVLLLLQYSLGMISHTGPVPFAEIAANQPKVIVKLVHLIGEIVR